MATRFTAGNIEVKLASDAKESRPVADPDAPFRIAVIGDFSGRGNRGAEIRGALSNRRVYPIDRDNFSEVMSQLKIELRLAIFGADCVPVTLQIAALDDFHPDRLFDNLEVFTPFKEIRHGLRDPATFAAVEKQLGPFSPPSGPASSQRVSERTGNLLDQIVDATDDQSSQSQSRPPSDLDEFIREVVKPHSQPKPNPLQAELLVKTDAAIGDLMRKILHDTDFQALEAAWRGLHFLVSQLETNESLKLFVIDVSKAELAADVLEADEISSTGLYKLLVKQTAETGDEEPWAVLAGDFTFDRTRGDAEVLSRMAKLAQATGAPFIAAAHPRFLGCESLAATPDPDEWPLPADNEGQKLCETLRKSPEASFLGLALPRFLLRLPYGKDTDPIERLDFEEMAIPPAHEEYLWGNPCYACIYLLALAFSQQGWDFHPGSVQEINGLPLHIYKEQGESRAKPCAEAILTMRAAEAILNQGLMPLLSFVHQDVVRLARFQSFANPPTALLGRWR
ncbi:MAG: type VI secretion system contractile sheath domain-containing protein [Alphaproteobacteria bacterium]